MTREELDERMRLPQDAEGRACIQCDTKNEVLEILRWAKDHGEGLSILANHLLEHPRRHPPLNAVHWCKNYGYGIGYTDCKIPYAEVKHLFKPDKIKPPTKKEFDKAFAAFFA